MGLALQVRPGALDFFQLPETVRAEVTEGGLVASLGRVHPKLPVELPPGEPERSLEGEHPVREPEV